VEAEAEPVVANDVAAGETLTADVLAELENRAQAFEEGQDPAPSLTETENEIVVPTASEGKNVFQSKPTLQPRVEDNDLVTTAGSDVIGTQTLDSSRIANVLNQPGQPKATSLLAFSHGQPTPEVDAMAGVEDEN